MIETRKTLCRICVNTCGVKVDVEDGRVLRLIGDDEDPLYAGYSCIKGRNHPQVYRHPDRLLHSRKRRPDGGFDELGAQRALDEIAARLSEIVSRHGPRSVAMYVGTYWFQDHPANLTLGDAFMRALGSPMIFDPTPIDQAGRFTAKGFHGVWLAPVCRDADIFMIVGGNPVVSHQGFAGSPGVFLREFLREGKQLIVLDPRRTEIARRATLHLQLLPGTDAWVLAAMIHVILTEDLADRAFLAENVDGVDRLRATVARFTPEAAAACAGIDAADIVTAARMFAATRRGSMCGGTGSNMSGYPTLVEYLMLCLDTLCGHWLREGDLVANALTIMPAAIQPAQAQAMPPFPAYGFGEQMRVRGLGRSLAGMPTPALAEEILLPGDGQVRALLSFGGNPVNAWPDQLRTIEALESLDLFVQSEVRMSPSAQLADYVLATKYPLEMPGTSMLSDLFSVISYGPQRSYARYTPAIVDPPEGSDVISHKSLIFGLAQRLGLILQVSPGVGAMAAGGATVTLDMTREPDDEELIDIVHAGSRIPIDTVRRHDGGAFYPDPPVRVAAKDPGWVGRLNVGSPEMMADLAALTTADASPVSPEFPLRLICRRSAHVNSSPSLGLVPGMDRYNPLYCHPDDLAALGIAPGDYVNLRSRRSAITAIVEADPTLRPGVVAMSHNWGGLPDSPDSYDKVGANTGRLIANDEHYDRYSGQPRMSNIPVAIEPIPARTDTTPDAVRGRLFRARAQLAEAMSSWH